MDKDSTQQLTKLLKDFSERNRTASSFDQTDCTATFEQILPLMTQVVVEFSEFSMFRSRAIWPMTDFEHIKQMGYPPAHRVKDFGRCHAPQQSILYAANNPETSFLEVDFSDDKPCAVIVQFRLKADERLRLLPIGELDHYRRHMRPRVQAPKAAEMLESLLAPLEHYDAITRQFVDAYLADYMSRIPDDVKERNLYQVTSHICGLLLQQVDVDGLIYPSVRHHGGLNYVIRPEVFDKKFEVQKFQLTQPLYNHGYGLFEYVVEADGMHLNEAGQFIWQRQYWHSPARSTWPLAAES